MNINYFNLKLKNKIKTLKLVYKGAILFIYLFFINNEIK